MTTGNDGVTLPIDTTTGTPAEVRLRATTNEGLLTAYAALTHKMDAAERVVGTWEEGSRRRIAVDLRAQRDLVHAEIVRRMQP